MLIRLVIFLAAFWAVGGVLQTHGADWNRRLAFSAFEDVDIDRMIEGKIEANRTPVNLPSAMAVESLYFIPANPRKTAWALLNWNPTHHKDLQVLLHHSVHVPARPEDFQPLSLDENQGEQRWLIKESVSAQPGRTPLHVSRQEIAKLNGKSASAMGTAWRQILLQRARVYQENGVEGLAGYDGERAFLLKDELHRLLYQLTPIKERFRVLLEQIWEGVEMKDTSCEVDSSSSPENFDPKKNWETFTSQMAEQEIYFLDGSLSEEFRSALEEMTGVQVQLHSDGGFEASESQPTPPASSPSAEKKEVQPELMTHYWEKLEVSNQATLLLGVIQAREQEGSWQVADFQYYVSANFYSSLVLYEIFPVVHNGQAGSLVWRGDYVLSPTISIMRGVERMFSENILLQEVKKAVSFFQEDLR